MRKDLSKLEPYRLTAATIRPDYAMYQSSPGDDFGMFLITRGKTQLRALLGPAIPEFGNWEHVSVSAVYTNNSGKSIMRIPTWEEMCAIKELFFEDEEAVLQFHPPKSRYVDIAPNCLHLWRPAGANVAMPPLNLV